MGKEMKKVDMTLVGKFNRMLGKGIFALEVACDGLALAARSIRDAMFTIASRAAKLADNEGEMKETFERVDDKIDGALGR